MPSAAPTTVAGGGGTKPKWNDDEVEQAAVARFDIFMVKLQNQNSLFTKSRVQQKFLQFNSLQGAAAIHTSHLLHTQPQPKRSATEPLFSASAAIACVCKLTTPGAREQEGTTSNRQSKTRRVSGQGHKARTTASDTTLPGVRLLKILWLTVCCCRGAGASAERHSPL